MSLLTVQDYLYCTDQSQIIAKKAVKHFYSDYTTLYPNLQTRGSQTHKKVFYDTTCLFLNIQ